MKKLSIDVRVLVPSIVAVAAVLAVACGDDPATDPGGDADAGSDSGASTSGGTDSGGPARPDGGSSSGGTDASADATVDAGGDAEVDAAPATYPVSGTVAGLAGTGLVLQLNGGQDQTVAASGPFAFPTPLPSGSTYAVTVKTQPTATPPQTCTVANGSGAISNAAVTNVAVTCATSTFTVGGTITGLSGSVVLTNNGVDDLTVAANGAFAFATKVPSAGAYAVAVKTQSTTHTCTVTDGSGTVGAANVTSVAIDCKPKSCKAIKDLNNGAADGDYVIHPANAPAPITTFCDMTTDGGGYSYVAVTGGISTTNKDQPNSCDAMGLKLVIPRSLAHAQALYAKYGATYFQTVPGIYGTRGNNGGNNRNYTGCAMQSGDNTICSQDWKALDDGAWFIRNVPYGEPNGDYTEGCWLSATWDTFDGNGFRVNDLNCGYATGGNYICSDNGK